MPPHAGARLCEPAAAVVIQPLLRAERLVKHFKAVRAVDDISFELFPGETLALVGESGCGKCSTGRVLPPTIEPTSGRVWFREHDLFKLSMEKMRSLRREMQIIFQDPYSSLNPRMTVRDMLAEPLFLHKLKPGRERERVAELLRLVGLGPGDPGRHPPQFSRGARPRLSVAAPLPAEARPLVGHEPVSSPHR